MHFIARAVRSWPIAGLIIVFAMSGCAGNVGSSFSPGVRSPGQNNLTNAGSTFTVTSKTFMNNGQIPQSMVYNGVAGSTCTGKDESPQLAWSGAPAGTKTFVVLMFDETASFTHWGMYDIPASTTMLPENAGVAGSKYGQQVINDFFVAARYDGPCPPPGLVHHYVITVYAMNCSLSLPLPPGFPPVGETLLYALIQNRSMILGTASITGLYST